MIQNMFHPDPPVEGFQFLLCTILYLYLLINLYNEILLVI